MTISNDASLAVHRRQLDDIEKWQDKHEREDDERHTRLGTDVSKLVTEFTLLNKTLEPIIKSYWGEETSKVRHEFDTKMPSSRPKARVSPELRQGGVIAGLIAVVLALAEVVKALVHPAPPPPPTMEQIASEVAKALQKAKP